MLTFKDHGFLAVVEQHLKNAPEDKLVLGCFFNLQFVASAGHVCKSMGHVSGRVGKCWKVLKHFKLSIKKGWSKIKDVH